MYLLMICGNLIFETSVLILISYCPSNLSVKYFAFIFFFAKTMLRIKTADYLGILSLEGPILQAPVTAQLNATNTITLSQTMINYYLPLLTMTRH